MGIATLLFGATATFSELRAALGKIFGEPGNLPLIDLVRTRAVALGLAVGAGLLLSVTLIAATVISAATAAFARGSVGATITLATSELVTFVVVAAVFTALTALLPAAGPLARGRDRHRAALRARQVRARGLYRPRRQRFGVRRLGVDDRRDALGLLFNVDVPARRRGGECSGGAEKISVDYSNIKR